MSESHDSQFEKKHSEQQPEQPESVQSNESMPTPNALFKAELKQWNDAQIPVPPELDEKIRAAAEEKWGSIDPPRLWFGKWVMPLTSAAMIGICVLLYSQNLFNTTNSESPATVAMNDRANDTNGMAAPLKPNAPTDSQFFAGGTSTDGAPLEKELERTGKPMSRTLDTIKQEKFGIKPESTGDAGLLTAELKKQADDKMKSDLSDKLGVASAKSRSRDLQEFPEDIDQSGQVDILDALHLAKVLELRKQSPDTQLPKRWDFNKDGQWNDADVNHLASHAVRIKPPQKGGAG